MKRLALLFATSGHSGVDRVVGNLLVAFGSLSQHFDLLTIRGHGPYPRAVPSNVAWSRLSCAHRNTVLFPLVHYLRAYRPASLLTANHRLNRAALIARRLAGTRTHVAIRMGMSPSASASAMGPRAGRRLLASMRKWYPRADAVIAPSTGVGQDLMAHAGVSPARLHVIPNPIVDERLFDQAAQALDYPWFTGGETPVILGVGSLEPRKDFATLVRAFAELRRDRRARLVILGRGRERERLLALAGELGVGEDVRLLGFEENPYRWMARANAFALTSQREGSGAVLVEAMACGTPVVATDCPSGPAEILGGGRFGELAPVGDSRAVAAGLRRLLDEPTPRPLLEQAVAPFDAHRSAQQYLKAMGVAP